MFNFFNKSPKTETKASTSNYPAIVDEIHNEFFTAGDNILNEAKSLLSQLETQDIAKGKRLAALGFGKTREAVAAIETENKLATTKEIAELVVYYKVNYPNNKFITEEQVKAICEKYGLVCGETSAYKGFVPESKLKMIESFVVNKKDKRDNVIQISKWLFSSQEVLHKLVKEKYPDLIIPYKEMNFYSGGYIKIQGEYAWIKQYQEISFNSLFICAPQKEMELGLLKKVGNMFHSVKTVNIPDPVVLQPVRGGYLIVCAWGDEASDEIVVNQQMN
jgi:hypothetical protein